MKQKTKNIILYIFLCIVTLLVLFGCVRISEKRRENELSVSSVKNYLSEIKYEEISTNVLENPEAIIYVSNSSDEKSNDFEKLFIPLIKKYNLENDIIYININGLVLKDAFYQNAPQLIFYKNSKVSDMIDCTVLKNKKDIINILKERSVIGD